MTEVTVRSFGRLRDGRTCHAYTLANGVLEATVLDLGGAIQRLMVKDGRGRPADVVLGYDTVAGYEDNPAYLGVTVGRVAGRIRDACFALSGAEYSLAKNCGQDSAHGGEEGFHKKLWAAEVLHTPRGEALRLTLHSPDLEEGYPGALDVSVVYSLTGSRLILAYEARSDRDTVCSLTNHSYFNLSGAGAGSILAHLCLINADEIAKADARLLPTGEMLPVKGTPFDFTDFHTIGARIHESNEQLEYGGGYDHTYALRKPSLDAVAAVLLDPVSERKMTVYTDLPGMQFYTGNALDVREGKGGASYGPHAGLCLETQLFPDAVNIPAFPSPVLRAGELYEYTTIYKFGNL